MVIHVDVADKDLKKCLRKRWYPGLEIELKRILKLLLIDGQLPGETLMSDFDSDLAGCIYHARISLPKTSFGKRKGPRLVFFRNTTIIGEYSLKVLYVGGHKDRIYGTAHFVEIVKTRCLDVANLISYEEFAY